MDEAQVRENREPEAAIAAQADAMAACARVLCRAARDCDPASAAEALVHEGESGRLGRIAAEALAGGGRCTFDRGLARDLVTALDDAADELGNAARELASDGGRPPPPSFLSDTAASAADAVREGVSALCTPTPSPSGTVDAAERVSALVDAARSRTAAPAPAPDGRVPPRDVAAEALSRAVDRLEDVASILRDIAYELD